MNPRLGSPSSAQSKVSDPAAERCPALIPDAHALVRDDEAATAKFSKRRRARSTRCEARLRANTRKSHGIPADAPPAPITAAVSLLGDGGEIRSATTATRPGAARLRASASAAITHPTGPAPTTTMSNSRLIGAPRSAHRAPAGESGPQPPSTATTARLSPAATGRRPAALNYANGAPAPKARRTTAPDRR